MLQRFPLFVDARYNAEQDVEFDSDDVVRVEEKMRSLFMGGQHKITVVTLRNGREHILGGHFKAQIKENKGTQ